MTGEIEAQTPSLHNEFAFFWCTPIIFSEDTWIGMGKEKRQGKSRTGVKEEGRREGGRGWKGEGYDENGMGHGGVNGEGGRLSLVMTLHMLDLMI